jgi:hypothetical protein
MYPHNPRCDCLKCAGEKFRAIIAGWETTFNIPRTPAESLPQDTSSRGFDYSNIADAVWADEDE